MQGSKTAMRNGRVAMRSGWVARRSSGRRIWESLTPFVPPRHIKYCASGVRDAPHEQLARLLALLGFPPAQLEALAAAPPRPSRG